MHPSGSKQTVQLPPVTAFVVTESSRVILGLKNFGIFWVFLTFMIGSTQIGFVFGMLGAIGVFFFIRTQIDAKPRHYIKHVLLYYMVIPRMFRHRPKDGLLL